MKPLAVLTVTALVLGVVTVAAVNEPVASPGKPIGHHAEDDGNSNQGPWPPIKRLPVSYEQAHNDCVDGPPASYTVCIAGPTWLAQSGYIPWGTP